MAYLGHACGRPTSSSRNLACQYGAAMHRKDCCELGAPELSDDIQDTILVGGMTNQSAKIRCMKLPVGARCRPDVIMELLHFGIFFGQWLRLR